MLLHVVIQRDTTGSFEVDTGPIDVGLDFVSMSDDTWTTRKGILRIPILILADWIMVAPEDP